MRWRLDLEYDGSAFAGFQLQPNANTVQAELERALSVLLAHPARVHAAGRTDTGVHARQQVVVVDSWAARSPHQIREGLNALLPEAIACLSARVVPDDFDPRHAPHAKTYVYTWCDRVARSPLRRGRAWMIRRPLDADAMDRAVAAIVGTHDFSSFRAEGCTSTHPVRTVPRAAVLRDDDEVRLTVEGTGFLRHMVRILAGTLTDVGLGRRPEDHVARVLAERRRSAAGQTAPPHGLCLVSIRYASEPDGSSRDGS